jgi:inner membrane protein
LFWPFDTHRYFAPWNPIPVAPIGRRFFSSSGMSVALVELLLFSPLFIYAVWPRKPQSSQPAG